MTQLLALLALMLLPETADACSCVWPGRPCRAFYEARAVFGGRVVQIGEIKAEQGHTQHLVRFDVTRRLKGVSGATAEVVTGRGGGDCGFDFKQGEEYLVYANDESGSKQLYTGICMRTRALDEAREDLAYFQKKDDPKLGSGILGQIEKLRREGQDGLATEWDGWLKHAAVTVTRGDQHWETSTDDEGQFAIWGLSAGSYRLHATVPAGYVGGENESVEIKSGTACSEVRILTLPEWKPAER